MFGGITMEETRGSAYLKTTSPVLYEVDLQSGTIKKRARRTDNQENYRDWLINSDGQISTTFDYLSRSGRWTIKNTEKDVIADGVSPLGRTGLISLGSTPGTIIYWEEDQDTGVDRWFEIPLTGGTPKEILGEGNISRRITDNRTDRLIGYEIEGDRPSYHFYNPFHQKVIEAVQKAFPGLSMELVDWNDSFTRLIVKTEGIGDPISWHIVDIKSGKADTLGTSYPMVSSDVGPMKMVRYTAQDGLEIEGVLTLPPGRDPKNLPVIIFPHGGPTARDYPDFDWWAQAFASRGHAVLQPNFRGSSGYGADFEQAGHGEWGLKMQTDISDGLAHLVKQGIADPKRACIMGASYGGYAALAGVTLQQGLYRCAVSVAGVSDVTKMVRTEMSESGRNAKVRRALQAEIGNHKDLKMVSPIRFADRADAPILLIHGKDDVVVLYDQSNDMEIALRRAGKPVELVTLKSEDHWLSKSETRMEMLEAAMAFITKHNPPDPAPVQKEIAKAGIAAP